MKRVALIAVLVAAAVSGPSPGADGSPGAQPRIVYRTVHLATPKRPPELYSVLPSGQGRRLLVRGGEQAAWSPDRRRIAFAGGGIAGHGGIWVMNANGTGKRRLTRTAGDGDPTWSPDGKRVAFRRSSATSFDLWIVPAAGGRARPLLVTPRASETGPDWSPDGKRIAFESTRGVEIEIWVMSAAGGPARMVTGGAASFSPDWAPDGRRIAFSKRTRIGIVDVARRRTRLLAVGQPASVDDPSWSPDGRMIAFERGGQVLTMRADGGGRRYVTRAAWGTNGEPDW